jgi:hypothetical protein
MATISLPLPGAGLIDEALRRFRWEFTHAEPGRRKAVRFPDPHPVLVPGIARPIVVKIASEPNEWEQAFRLDAANDRDRGHETITSKAYRFTPYHALPDTTLFVAREAGRVVVTCTLVADNTLLGLPMEAVYGAEVDGLRQQGRRLAEITSLAVAELSQREFLPVFTSMLRLMKQYHVSRGGDTWVITIDPRHRNFYCKVLGYQPLGPCKAYALEGNAPAEAYLLDRELMRAHAPRAYDLMFREWLPADVLTGVSLPRPFIRFFWSESNPADAERVGTLLRAVAAHGSPRAW